MLTLQKNKVNTLDVVCNDLLTIQDPVYLWRFVNNVTQQEYLIELENQQPVNPRFDQFLLNLPDDLNLNYGEFSWYIYQSDTPGDEIYDSMILLSSGDMRIIANFLENKSYEPTSGNNYEYQG